MAYIDYQVLTTALDDDIARLYVTWLKGELETHRAELHAMPGVSATIEMQEPLPGTNEPRVTLRLLFDNEGDFRSYNSDLGPKLRLSLEAAIAQWKQRGMSAKEPLVGNIPATPPATPVTRPAEQRLVRTSLIPPDAAAEPEAPPQVDAPKVDGPPLVRVTRRKTLVPRLPAYALWVPIGFAIATVLALWVAVESVEPLLRTVWPAAPNAGAAAAVASAKAEAMAKTDSPLVHRHAAGLAWVASYAGVLAMVSILIVLCLQVISRNVAERCIAPPTSFDDDPGAHKRKRSRVWGNTLVGVLFVVGFGLLVWGSFAPWGLKITPRVIQSAIEDGVIADSGTLARAIRFMMSLTALGGVALALAFGSLLLRQNAWNPRPVPLAVHLRLQSARFLLNTGSAMLVASVVQIAALTEMSLPLEMRHDTDVATFPLNYAITWGAIFTVILAGLYVPTIAMLTTWGHRSVILNSWDLKHTEVVAELGSYSTGVRAEFKPYISVLVALAPTAAAFLADLSKLGE